MTYVLIALAAYHAAAKAVPGYTGGGMTHLLIALAAYCVIRLIIDALFD